MSRRVESLRCSGSRRHAETSRFRSKRFPRGRFTGHPDLPPSGEISPFDGRSRTPASLCPDRPSSSHFSRQSPNRSRPALCFTRGTVRARKGNADASPRRRRAKDQSAASLVPPHEALKRQTSDAPLPARKQPITPLLLVAHSPRVGPLCADGPRGLRPTHDRGAPLHRDPEDLVSG